MERLNIKKSYMWAGFNAALDVCWIPLKVIFFCMAMSFVSNAFFDGMKFIDTKPYGLQIIMTVTTAILMVCWVGWRLFQVYMYNSLDAEEQAAINKAKLGEHAAELLR